MPRRWACAPGDTVLGALPLSGVFGYNAAMAGLAAGATVLLEPVFDADAVLDAVPEFVWREVRGQ